jgi:hypothetical protein
VAVVVLEVLEALVVVVAVVLEQHLDLLEVEPLILVVVEVDVDFQTLETILAQVALDT